MKQIIAYFLSLSSATQKNEIDIEHDSQQKCLP